MLFAHKEEKRLQAVSSSGGLSKLGSFGKVLSSIGGLQQRLEDFTLEEVAKAEDTAKTLTARLFELQQKLDAFAKIKQVICATSQAIEELPPSSASLADLETLDKSLQLHLAGQGSKLIPFPRPHQAGRDKPKFSPVDKPDTEARPVAGTIEMDVPPMSEDAIHESHWIEESPSTNEINSHAGTISADAVEGVAAEILDQENTFSFETFEIGEPGPAAIANESFTDSRFTDPIVLTDLRETSPKEPRELAASEWPSTGSFEISTIEQTEVTGLSETAQRDDEPSEPHQASPHAASESVAEFDNTFDDAVAITELPETSSRNEEPGASDATTTVPLPEPKALVPVNAGFDQRLLDDLIKNYGEFAVTPNLPATLEPVKISKPKAPSDTGPSQTAKSSSAKTNLPSYKKEIDLDRQLKKIIKDYGEYDLYSRQSPISLKMGVIGAFLFLCVLFSGFYFFSSSTTVSQPAPDAAISDSGTPDEPTVSSSERTLGGTVGNRSSVRVEASKSPGTDPTKDQNNKRLDN